jgi:hypothetical protein
VSADPVSLPLDSPPVLQPFPIFLDPSDLSVKSILVPTPGLPSPHLSHPVSGDQLVVSDSHGRNLDTFVHPDEGGQNCLAVRGGRTLNQAIAEFTAHASSCSHLPGHLKRIILWKGCNDLIKNKTFYPDISESDHLNFSIWLAQFQLRYSQLVNLLHSKFKLELITLLTIPITPKKLMERPDHAEFYLRKYRAANNYIRSLHLSAPYIRVIDISALFFIDRPPFSVANYFFAKNKDPFFNLVHLNGRGNEALYEYVMSQLE